MPKSWGLVLNRPEINFGLIAKVHFSELKDCEFEKGNSQLSTLNFQLRGSPALK
jgi:hypothetical protein